MNIQWLQLDKGYLHRQAEERKKKKTDQQENDNAVRVTTVGYLYWLTLTREKNGEDDMHVKREEGLHKIPPACRLETYFVWG